MSKESSGLYWWRTWSVIMSSSIFCRWTAYKTVYEDTPCTEMLGMVQALAAGLDNLSRRVCDAVLQLVLEHAAREVADFYLKDVVLDNFFDEPGINQLAVDVRLGIMPVFRQFNFDPDRASMSALAEILVLLEARRPNALLLAEAIRTATNDADLNQVCIRQIKSDELKLKSELDISLYIRRLRRLWLNLESPIFRRPLRTRYLKEEPTFSSYNASLGWKRTTGSRAEQECDNFVFQEI